MVDTGDITQIDLPRSKDSGLVEAEKILEGLTGVSFHHFDEEDVVRHPMVTEIIRAYDNHPDRKRRDGDRFEGES